MIDSAIQAEPLSRTVLLLQAIDVSLEAKSVALQRLPAKFLTVIPTLINVGAAARSKAGSSSSRSRMTRASILRHSIVLLLPQVPRLKKQYRSCPRMVVSARPYLEIPAPLYRQHVGEILPFRSIHNDARSRKRHMAAITIVISVEGANGLRYSQLVPGFLGDLNLMNTSPV